MDRGLLLRLYRLFLTKSGKPCPACMRYIEASVALTARGFRTPIVVGGSGATISYLSVFPELYEGGDVDFFRNVVAGESLEKEVGPAWHRWGDRREEIVKALYRVRVVRAGLRSLFGLSWDLVPLVVPSIGLFDFVDVKYATVVTTIQAEMGWTKPPGQLEQMDCLLHEIPFYTHALKFPELTTGTLHRSGVVRLGEMTRAEALEAEYDELRNPPGEPQILAPFLEEIGMSHDDFTSSVQDWRALEGFRPQR